MEWGEFPVRLVVSPHNTNQWLRMSTWCVLAGVPHSPHTLTLWFTWLALPLQLLLLLLLHLLLLGEQSHIRVWAHIHICWHERCMSEQDIPCILEHTQSTSTPPYWHLEPNRTHIHIHECCMSEQDLPCILEHTQSTPTPPSCYLGPDRI